MKSVEESPETQNKESQEEPIENNQPEIPKKKFPKKRSYKKALIILITLVLILFAVSIAIKYIPNQDSTISIYDSYLNLQCQAWKTQDPSYCSAFQVNESDNRYSVIKQEEENCLWYYYGTRLLITKDPTICDNLPDIIRHLNQTCHDRAEAISNLMNEGFTEENVKNMCKEKAGSDLVECVAMILRDPAYCDQMMEKEFYEYHVKSCKIFSSNPEQLNCDDFK